MRDLLLLAVGSARPIPQVGGGGGGGAVWDSGNTANVTLSGSDLVATFASGYTQGGTRADTSCSGKCFWRIILTDITSTEPYVGLGIIAGTDVTANWPTTSCVIEDYGQTKVDNVYAGDGLSGGTAAQGDYVDIAFDATNLLFWARKNNTGTWNNNGTDNPATGTGGISVTSGTYYPWVGGYSGGGDMVFTAVFSDDSSGAAPSGFSWLS